MTATRVQRALELAEAEQPLVTMGNDAHKLAQWLMVGERTRVALVNVLLHLVDAERAAKEEPTESERIAAIRRAGDDMLCECGHRVGDHGTLEGDPVFCHSRIGKRTWCQCTSVRIVEPSEQAASGDVSGEQDALWPELMTGLYSLVNKLKSDDLLSLAENFDAAGKSIQMHLANKRAERDSLRSQLAASEARVRELSESIGIIRESGVLALSNEKAAHEVTRSEVDNLRSELVFERGWDLWRKARYEAVVEAAREMTECGDSTPMLYMLNDLRNAVEALSQLPPAEPSTPVAEREIVVGSTWRSGIGHEVVVRAVDVVHGEKYVKLRGVGPGGWPVGQFSREFTWLSNPGGPNGE